MQVQGPNGVEDPELPGMDLDVTIEGSTARFENPDEDGEWLEYDGLIHTLNGNSE